MNNELLKIYRRMSIIGIILMLLGFAFAVIETKYFGSNWFPVSEQEFLCDFIASAICGSGMGLYIYSISSIIIMGYRDEKEKLKELKRFEDYEQ